MILMIDNYDSFTYNLVQYLGILGKKLKVYRNDKIKLKEIEQLKPASIVISPGPGRPEDAGISCKVIEHFSGKVPILGVCLGHQCIVEVFGGKIVRAKNLMHGKTSLIYHKNCVLFKGISNPFVATRYHSLIAENKSFPKNILRIEASTKDGEIMAAKHVKHDTWGVQFHPESILTKEGMKILKNFVNISKKRKNKYD